MCRKIVDMSVLMHVYVGFSPCIKHLADTGIPFCLGFLADLTFLRPDIIIKQIPNSLDSFGIPCLQYGFVRQIIADGFAAWIYLAGKFWCDTC